MGVTSSTGAASLSEGRRLVALRRGKLARWIRSHPLIANATLAILNLILQATTIALNYQVGLREGRDYPVFGFILLLVGNLVFSGLIFMRNKAPFAFLLIALAVDFAYFLYAGEYTSNSLTGYSIWIFLYTIAVKRSLKITILAYSAATSIMCAMFFPMVFGSQSEMKDITGDIPPSQNPWPYIIFLLFMIGFTAVFNLVIVLVGRFTRKNDLFDQELVERFEQTQALAANEERTRIAREMHDVVAHSLTVMIALADGARIVGQKNPERAAEVLSELSNTGRTALADMRRTLGVLRDPDAQNAPLLPAEGASKDALENLAELVDSFASTGLPVTFYHDGQNIPADNNLRLSLYRIVQESLTNALRYGRQVSEVSVMVSVALPNIWVTVMNDGSAALDSLSYRSAGLSQLGSGKGLAGIRERVAFYNGTFECGPNDRGGWTNRAHLKWNPAAELAGD